MGRPGPLLDRQIAGKRSLIDALVQLKEMRVGVTNADPEDVRRTFVWESAESGHRQKKCAERDGREFILERIGGRRIDRGERRQGEMDLRWTRKNQAAILRVERDQGFCDFIRYIDGDE